MGDKKLPKVRPGRVTLWAIEKLTPYSRNARTHPPEQIAQLAASIRAFGFVGSIIVRDGVIGKGHGTLAAVSSLYAEDVDVYPAPGERGGALPYPRGTIPVTDVSGWSDEQFRAFVIADNRIAESSGWDKQLLHIELADLKSLGFDIGVTGFDEDELDKALQAVSHVTEVDVSDLQDRFWISLRGPLKQQARVLKAMRAATQGLEGVVVELGTINESL